MSEQEDVVFYCHMTTRGAYLLKDNPNTPEDLRIALDNAIANVRNNDEPRHYAKIIIKVEN